MELPGHPQTPRIRRARKLVGVEHRSFAQRQLRCDQRRRFCFFASAGAYAPLNVHMVLVANRDLLHRKKWRRARSCLEPSQLVRGSRWRTQLYPTDTESQRWRRSREGDQYIRTGDAGVFRSSLATIRELSRVCQLELSCQLLPLLRIRRYTSS
jgi:hypothetical protein